MRPFFPRRVARIAVILAATLSVTQASGEEPTTLLPGDAEQLRAYAATLLQEVEQLRAELARVSRERDELARKIAREASHVRKSDEPLPPARGTRTEGSQLAESAGLQPSDSGRTERVDGAAESHAADGAEAPPVQEAVAGGGGRPRATSKQPPAGSSGAANDGVSPKKQPDVESQLIRGLETQLRELRDREEALRTSAKDLEEALDAEKRAARSKLEALESVLLDTRSASTQLRTELDETRQRNTDLSREVSRLQVATQNTARPKADDQLQQTASLQGPTRPSREGRRQARSPRSEPGSSEPEQTKELASTADPGRTNPVEPPSGAGIDDATEDPVATNDLQEQLSVERERRETLEEEVKRLSTSGNSDDRFVEVWNALQSARSEILVLGNQLAEERKDREDLEIALARTQQDPANKSNKDVARRLAETLNDRRSQADRLAAQLKDANEIIVRLKGRLEASGSPEGHDKLLAELQKDNETLRDALQAAEQANEALRGKAEMAQRLAEMVYGKGP
jgi:DNA repair exonuclease SbcCD ATPase subunit